MRVHKSIAGKCLPALLLALAGWSALSAQQTAQVWQPALPGAPYALGRNPENGTVAPDEPIPGFVGPAGDGAAPYYGQNEGQLVNPAFVEWASSVANYSPAKPAAIDSSYTNANVALGPVTGDVFDVVSLGDLSATDILAGTSPGTLTLGFATPIADGPGPDFAVFGNAFKLQAQGREMVFSKLAYVEVSSDGVNFARFPCVDANPRPAQATWPYMVADPTLIYNLFGKAMNGYGVSWGVPFDLAQLRKSPLVTTGLLDLQKVRYVRFVAVVGNGAFSADSLGNPIYDPWPTYGSPGPEVQAVGVLNIAASNTTAAPSLARAATASVAATPIMPSGIAKLNSATASFSASASPFAFLGSTYTAFRNAAVVFAAAESNPPDDATPPASLADAAPPVHAESTPLVSATLATSSSNPFSPSHANSLAPAGENISFPATFANVNAAANAKLPNANFRAGMSSPKQTGAENLRAASAGKFTVLAAASTADDNFVYPACFALAGALAGALFFAFGRGVKAWRTR